MKPKIVHPTTLADATFNYHPSNANDDQSVTYGRGVLVGLVSALVAIGYTFEEAIQTVKAHSRPIHKDCLPTGWDEEWDKHPYRKES